MAGGVVEGAAGRRAMDELLEILMRDKAWSDELARKTYVAILDIIEPAKVKVADGQVANANLSDYEIPAFADLPGELSHDLIEREGAEIHGLGETALPPVPAAIGNALGSLGVHVTELPMTPETVLAAIDQRAVSAVR